MTLDDTPQGVHSRPLSIVLSELAADTSVERLSIADLLAALNDRAMAALLLMFALPNVIPTPPGTSAVLGAPLVFLAAQLTFGRRPWLPGFISRRSMPHSYFAAFVVRAVPWLQRAERMLQPRGEWLSRPPFEYAVGAVCLLMAVIIFLPIPMGNILPAFSVCLCALGILERDGLWIAAGLASAAASVGLVWGMVYAVVKSALFLLAGAVG
ncbi:MAG: exopolysaccharide biosynthesis protein [Rubrivivax sp.]|nr:MAG: exopolysaccharide biosynthesis protein [Rubrivivax sp.]